MLGLRLQVLREKNLRRPCHQGKPGDIRVKYIFLKQFCQSFFQLDWTNLQFWSRRTRWRQVTFILPYLNIWRVRWEYNIWARVAEHCCKSSYQSIHKGVWMGLTSPPTLRSVECSHVYQREKLSIWGWRENLKVWQLGPLQFSIPYLESDWNLSNKLFADMSDLSSCTPNLVILVSKAHWII